MNHTAWLLGLWIAFGPGVVVTIHAARQARIRRGIRQLEHHANPTANRTDQPRGETL